LIEKRHEQANNQQEMTMKKSKKKIKVRDMKPKKNPRAGGIGHPAPQKVGKGNVN
jgi:hypothetical protein